MTCKMATLFTYSRACLHGTVPDQPQSCHCLYYPCTGCGTTGGQIEVHLFLDIKYGCTCVCTYTWRAEEDIQQQMKRTPTPVAENAIDSFLRACQQQAQVRKCPLAVQRSMHAAKPCTANRLSQSFRSERKPIKSSVHAK